jgi:hypothetical protein
LVIRGRRGIKPHHDGHDFVMDLPGRLYILPTWRTHAVENEGGRRVHLLFSSYRHVNDPAVSGVFPLPEASETA